MQQDGTGSYSFNPGNFGGVLGGGGQSQAGGMPTAFSTLVRSQNNNNTGGQGLSTEASQSLYPQQNAMRVASGAGLPPQQQPQPQQGQQQQGGQFPSADILALLSQSGGAALGGKRLSMPGAGGLGIGSTGPTGETSGGSMGGGMGGLGLGQGMSQQPSMHDPQSTFDLSVDFPALTVGMTALSMNESDSLAGRYGSSYRTEYRQEPTHSADGFPMLNDDFPALPGSAPSAQMRGGEAASNFSRQLQILHPMTGKLLHPLPDSNGTDNSGSLGLPLALHGNHGPQVGGSGGLSLSTAGSAGQQASSEDPTKNYSLLGLLRVIRMTDPDLNMLALGSDLTTLGLNLDSTDVLYATFASPWADAPTTREPQYQLPMCYYMQPPALKTTHFTKFQLETLFYIFYAMPQDVLQAYAAQELYHHEWRYHTELKLWIKRATAADGITQPGVQFIYFDHAAWERRGFSGNLHHNIGSGLAAGLMPEEEIRVKFTAA